MSDDEVVAMTLLDEEGEPVEVEEVERRPVPWPWLVVAVSAVVGALALCVGAWALVGERRASERLACLQEAQLVAFGLQTRSPGDDPRRVIVDRLRSCGVDLPEE